MRKSLVTAGALAFAALSFSSISSAGTFIPLPLYPGSISTSVLDISNANVLVGNYMNPDGTVHGFFGTMDGNYTSFDTPSGNTNPRFINDDGYITGWGAPAGEGIFGDAFLRKPDGTIVPVTKDDVTIDGQSTGIRQHVKFVGEWWYYDPNQAHFYTYGFYGKGHKWQGDLTLPFNTDSTRPRGYNKSEMVIGYFRNLGGAAQILQGFVLASGVATAFADPDPDAAGTLAEGVNDRGIIAGWWYNNGATVTRAFLFNPSTNEFSQINSFGANQMSAFGINNDGLVALNITDDITYNETPYVYCSRKKTCPQSPNAIEVPDKWIKAPPGSVHSVVCDNRCLGPAHVTGKPADPAVIREAIAHDPTLRGEMGMRFRH
jgi:hypothetical protein